jgi:hypothetical protein
MSLLPIYIGLLSLGIGLFYLSHKWRKEDKERAERKQQKSSHVPEC